jgi:uncharacterized protein (TIGR03118 family)
MKVEGKINVYDTNFSPVKISEQMFDDDRLPKGFAPFNVQNIGNKLYVTYAKQNSAKNFVEVGAGLGFVDVFSTRGQLLMRLEHGDWFNAPWGLVLAPTDFGNFSHKLIVGQFGSGEILAFDAVTGRFEGNSGTRATVSLCSLGSGAFLLVLDSHRRRTRDPPTRSFLMLASTRERVASSAA